MSVLHPTALRGFQNQASAYVKARPSYPSAALDVICSLFSNPLSSKKILDLGAGTGIMTKLLVERGFDVTAVEPVDGMRGTRVSTSKGRESLGRLSSAQG
ncbi:hypothetical protein RMCBS344292_18095 [Rhizopus microsporus]|nr:hypothetical protein RMCBS344292_18095 [Rhizopus microsporus]